MPNPEIKIRPIRESDNAEVARLIREVMPEFGAEGPGYAIHDPEVDCMFETYGKPDSRYFVIEMSSRILGGAGIAPLKGSGDSSEHKTCELQKMYFYPEVRNLGFGQKLLSLCLEFAKNAGFSRCYLETLTHMSAARKLYERNGFQRLAAPLGATGHFSCDVWYLKNLDALKQPGVG